METHGGAAGSRHTQATTEQNKWSFKFLHDDSQGRVTSPSHSTDLREGRAARTREASVCASTLPGGDVSQSNPAGGEKLKSLAEPKPRS